MNCFREFAKFSSDFEAFHAVLHGGAQVFGDRGHAVRADA